MGNVISKSKSKPSSHRTESRRPSILSILNRSNHSDSELPLDYSPTSACTPTLRRQPNHKRSSSKNSNAANHHHNHSDVPELRLDRHENTENTHSSKSTSCISPTEDNNQHYFITHVDKRLEEHEISTPQYEEIYGALSPTDEQGLEKVELPNSIYNNDNILTVTVKTFIPKYPAEKLLMELFNDPRYEAIKHREWDR
ncbi:hypothetical protein BDF14DRAFT_916714 [Spinellus fusiger]|nr:hypothetical protein BDF14DRAFT_916714 [Spinellus fusiger]